jgi:hypothetical protein
MQNLETQISDTPPNSKIVKKIGKIQQQLRYLSQKKRKDRELFNLNGLWLDVQNLEQELQALRQQIHSSASFRFLKEA